MRWLAHIAIAGSICAVFNPLALPAACAGSTAPDWFEFIAKRWRDKRIKHRGATHYLAMWLLLMAFGQFVYDLRGWIFWFAFGGAIHWVCDALTVTGAPVGWWSDRRITLFGGKLVTGGRAEYVIAATVVLVCVFLMWTRATKGSGFIPFFYDWSGFYEKGVVDGAEWRANRFSFF